MAGECRAGDLNEVKDIADKMNAPKEYAQRADDWQLEIDVGPIE